MTEQIDPAKIHEQIARKSATRPKVDNQGRPTEPLVTYEYDRHGNLIGPTPPDDAA